MAFQTLNHLMDLSEGNQGFSLFANSIENRYDGPSKKPARQGKLRNFPFH